MSDPVVPASATGVVEPAPAPAPAPSTVDFSDLTSVLKLALGKIAEVEMEGELAVDDKIKKVAELVKSEIRAADLPLSVRTAAMDWVNDALPHVIKAVDLVKAEVKKAALAEVGKIEAVALAEVRKCCPSLFSRKA
uniref:Uncharacterized protein n=1 Tax=viral metagenome TaxID=1070528 RepID=A0A6C0AJC8_9ZZZZ